MRRCNDPSNQQYPHYGGRGIKLHPDFLNKVSFANYVKTLPNAHESLSLDRINNDGDYAPGNLRWATQKEQVRNTRNTTFTTYNGACISAKEFAEKYVRKFIPQTVARLAAKGLSGEEILERESKCTRAGLRYRKRGAKT